MEQESTSRRLHGPALAAVIIAVVLSAFTLLKGFNTFLIFWAIFLPMIVAGFLVIRGVRQFPKGAFWVIGAGFTFIPAAYMSMASLCHRGEGTCGDLGNAHKAIIALIALAIAFAILFFARHAAAQAVFIGLTAFSEIWMFLRLRKGEDMAFAAILVLILLVVAIVFQVAAYLREKAVEKELQAIAAGGGGTAPAA